MGSDLGDFLRQMPLGPVITFCASGILMVIALVAIIQARARKARETQQAQAPSYYTAPTADSDMADLPDLDMLTTTMPTPAAPVAVETAPPRPVRKGMYTVKLTDGSSTDAVEVMTILRDVVDGGLMVQMGDKIFRSLAGDDTQKNNFLKIMREVAVIVKAPGNAPAVMSQPEPESEPEALQPDEPEESNSLRDLVDPPQEPAQPATRNPAPLLPSTPLPGDLPKFKLDPLPAKKPGGILRRGKLEFEPVPELNIAGAIETYLQHKLQFTPEYAGRSIHVHAAPGGGVSIEVDGKFFEAVGDVDDLAVRQFLQATIQEWQQRN